METGDVQGKISRGLQDLVAVLPSLKTSAITLFLAILADDLMTYIYVKVPGAYVEVNTLVAALLGEPALWAVCEATLFTFTVLLSLCFRSLLAYVEAAARQLKIAGWMRRAWTYPIWLAAAIRLAATVSNMLQVLGIAPPYSLSI